MRIDKEIIGFFEGQDSVIVSTLDDQGRIHCSIKGIISAESDENLFLIDLYLYRTFRNLKKDPKISITAFDDHLFKGYTLQGMAEIIPRDKLHEKIFVEWEKRVVHRISKRVARSVKAGLRSKVHHEAQLPLHPQYLIKVNIEKLIDLAPPHAKRIKDTS